MFDQPSHFGISLFSLKREPPSLLDSVDNILGRPLLSFCNLAEVDDAVLDVDSASLSFGYYSIVKDDALSRSAPMQINDELVMRMKRPIDLPPEDLQVDDYSELTHMISLASRHNPLASPRRRHHERALAPDVACCGSTHCSAPLSLETPDTPRRSRSFGHVH